jgi:hypothetical protein
MASQKETRVELPATTLQHQAFQARLALEIKHSVANLRGKKEENETSLFSTVPVFVPSLSW